MIRGSPSYVADAGRDLVAKVPSLRLLVLPGVPVSGDMSDWLDAAAAPWTSCAVSLMQPLSMSRRLLPSPSRRAL